MSVCVAAACEWSKVIVTATDRLLSFPHTSLEVALKAGYIAPKWLALLAGDDIRMAPKLFSTRCETRWPTIKKSS